MMRLLLLAFFFIPQTVAAQSVLGELRSLPPPLEDGVRTDIDGKVRTHVKFRLCVDSSGRITCLDPLPKQSSALVNAMLERVPTWRFTAASRDGSNVSAESTLLINLEGQRDAAGKYQMTVVGVSTGPRYAKVKLPKYPESALRALRTGGVLLTALVMPNGSVEHVVAVEDVSDRAFVSAAVSAVKHWSFEPEKINGEAVATKVTLPVVFSIPGQQPPLLRWMEKGSSSDDGPIAQDSVIRLLEGPED